MNIKILANQQINAALWDARVVACKAPIYCRFNYLNALADNWCAIVIGENYDGLMPICYRKFFFIKYSYTPAFVQQLGFWGNHHNLQKQIIQKIKKHFWLGDVMLNHTNIFFDINTTPKTNFIIDLTKNYEQIKALYKQDLLNNLKKAQKNNLLYLPSQNVEQAINLYQQFYADRIPQTSAKDFANFKQLCQQLQQQKMCFVREITNEKKDLLAIALFLKDDNRTYNIINAISPKGRNAEANHFLIDRVLYEFAGQNLLFDFEGSSLAGVKSFYQKFGPVNEPYFHWKI